MKTCFFRILGILFSIGYTTATYANGNKNILGEEDDGKIRKGEFTIDDLPNILTNAADYLLGFAGTISVIFIIIGAYQWGLGSVSSDVSSGKKKVGMAIVGFILASLSWWIVKFVADNLSF